MPDYRVTTANGFEFRGSSNLTLEAIGKALKDEGQFTMDVSWASKDTPASQGPTIFLSNTICSLGQLP